MLHLFTKNSYISFHPERNPVCQQSYMTTSHRSLTNIPDIYNS